MTAKLYSLPAFRNGQRSGLPVREATIFSRHIATELFADGELLPDPNAPSKVVARVAAPVVAPEPRQAEHPQVKDYGAPYGYFVGAKFEQGRPIKEIARLVKIDIAEQVKAGNLPKAKYTVRYSSAHAAHGSSLKIRVSELPDGFDLLNPKRVAAERSDAHGWYGQYPRFSENGRAFRDALNEIGRAYQFDRSDSASDFYNVNFYLDAEVDHKTERMLADQMVISEVV